MSDPGIGHNSEKLGEDGLVLPADSDQLLAYIERVERLEEEKKAIADDIKDIYGEAKGTGFDPKIMRQIVIMRKMDANERREQRAFMDLYLEALGMY